MPPEPAGRPRATGPGRTERSARPYWSRSLRALRETRGVTQEGWAALLGVGRATVQRWEAGRTPPDAFAEQALIALCHEQGLFRRFEQGPLRGTELTEGRLRDLLAEARLGGHASRSVRGSTRGPDPEPPRSVGRGPFVGRKRELDVLRSALNDAMAGRGSVVTLAGKAGIGKTRLAQEFEVHARQRGAHVLWGRSYELGDAPPYWPWIEVGNAWGAAVDLLGAGLSRLQSAAIDLGELGRLFPALRDAPGFVKPDDHPDPGVGQVQLFDAFTRFVRHQSEEAAWVIVLDDLQWADQPTIELAAFLARSLSDMRVLLVGTYRDDEQPRAAQMPLALAEMGRTARLRQLRLKGLSPEEVAAYVRATANTVTDNLAQRVFETTEGNPFFVGEVIDVLNEDGALEPGRGKPDTRLPRRVRGALGSRLSKLRAETRGLLEYVAVAGGQIAFATLSEVTRLDDSTLVSLVDEALRAHVLEESERPGRYRFTHALMEETVLAGMSHTKQAHLHGEIGMALERRLGDRSVQQVTRLARHFSEAARVEERFRSKALHYLETAGAQAEGSFAWAQAAESYRQWLDLAPDADRPQRARILEAQASAARFANPDQGEAWYGLVEAIKEYRDIGDPIGVARSTLKAMALPVSTKGREALAASAWEQIRGIDPVMEGQIIACRLRLGGLEPAVAETMERRLDELLREVDAPVLHADAEAVRLDRAIRARRLDNVVENARTTADRYESLGDMRAAAAAVHTGYLALSLLGAVDAGREALERLLTIAEASGNDLIAGYAQMGLAGVYRTRSDWGAFRRATASIPSLNFTGRLYAAEFQELRGDGTRACALLPPPERAGPVKGFQLIIHGSRARTAFNAGGITDARADFAEWRRVFEATLTADPSPTPKTMETVAYPFPLESAVALADDCLVAVAPDDLARTALAVLEATPEIRAAAEFRGIDRLRGALALRLSGPIAAAPHYEAGLAWAERERCPLDRGRCLLGLATVAALRDEVDEAVALVDQSIEEFIACDVGLYLEDALALRAALGARPGAATTARTSLLRRLAADDVRGALSDHSVIAVVDGEPVRRERTGTDVAAERERVRRQAEAVHAATSAGGGTVLTTVGRASMLLFESAPDAVAAVSELPAVLADAGLDVDLRIGMQTAQAEEPGQPAGTELHTGRAAALSAAAAPGDVLVTPAVHRLLETARPGHDLKPHEALAVDRDERLEEIFALTLNRARHIED